MVDFVGLHDRRLGDVFLWYRREEAAPRDLEAIVKDEPGWQGKFEIVTIRLGGNERSRLNEVP